MSKTLRVERSYLVRRNQVVVLSVPDDFDLAAAQDHRDA